MYDTLVVTNSLPATALAKLRTVFYSVHYHPDGVVPDGVLSQAEIFYSTMRGLPSCVTSIEQVPKLVHVQLPSAGADKALAHPVIVSALAEGVSPPFTLATASGTHAISIAQYVLGTTLMFTNALLRQATFARIEQRWGSGEELADDSQCKVFDRSTAANETAFFNRSLRGKTVGILGYGHIGREVARLFQTFGSIVVAANTDGKARADDGYSIPGTGDPSGSIPQKYYSTAEPAQLTEFLSLSNVLVCILPSTAATRYSLDAAKLDTLSASLPPDAILINVGRGDLISSDDILVSLDREEGLLGVALDVTDPEPLPAGHAFFGHPKVLVTPHLSGEAENELLTGVEILIENVRRLREGKRLTNLVDYHKGY